MKSSVIFSCEWRKEVFFGEGEKKREKKGRKNRGKEKISTN
jgi:hypothetical protein